MRNDISESDCCAIVLLTAGIRVNWVHPANDSSRLLFVVGDGNLYEATSNYGSYDETPIYVARRGYALKVEGYDLGRPLYVLTGDDTVTKCDQYGDVEGYPLYCRYGYSIYKCDRYGDRVGSPLYTLE